MEDNIKDNEVPEDKEDSKESKKHIFTENGLTLEICSCNKNDGPMPPTYMPIMGGDDRNPTWEEYKEDYLVKYRPHLELIKRGIIEMGWMYEKADKISNYWYFNFSDGECWGFSWRAWGDLMQAIVNKREGYMTYYM